MIEEDDVDSLYNIFVNEDYNVEAEDDWYTEKLLLLSTHSNEDIRKAVADHILYGYTYVLDDAQLNQFINLFKADKDPAARDYADWIVVRGSKE